MAASSETELELDLSPFLRLYKDGRVERLLDSEPAPPSVDPTTGVASKDVVIDPATPISARFYLAARTPAAASKLPVLIYYHGGGFCFESAFSSRYHAFLNSLVAEARVVAVSVEYRLAPEHPLPAAYDDAWRALRWVAEGGGGDPWLAAERVDFSIVFLAGDSAGANIAHNVAMRAGEEGLGGPAVEVGGVILLHPYFWGTERLPSEQVRGDSAGAPPLITPEIAEKTWWLASGGRAGSDDPRINPVAEGAPSLAGLAGWRVMVAVAEEDTLRDRGKAYCEELRKSGWKGEVVLWETEAEDHAFFLFRPESDRAVAIVKRLADFTQCKSMVA